MLPRRLFFLQKPTAACLLPLRFPQTLCSNARSLWFWSTSASQAKPKVAQEGEKQTKDVYVKRYPTTYRNLTMAEWRVKIEEINMLLMEILFAGLTILYILCIGIAIIGATVESILRTK